MIHTLSSDKEKALFRASIDAVTKDNGIGTLNEKTLHAVIKQYIEPNESFREVKIGVGRTVADIFNDSGIVEIQTRSYEKLIKKLPRLFDIAPVTVVLPLPHIKTVSWIDTESGETTKKRKSPKTGRAYDGLYELSKIKKLLSDDRLCIRIMLIDMDEYRKLDGWGDGGKRGSSRHDRIPTELYCEYILRSKEDYMIFVPELLPKEFTLKDYMKSAKLKQRYGSAGIYILRELGIVSLIGKKGRENLYQLSNPPINASSPSITQNPASEE